MKANVLVNCQYFENYNVGPDGFNTFGDGTPHWKPKGGSTFLMPVDSDSIMYCDQHEIEDAIKVLVEKQNTVACRFQFIDFEVQWSEPETIEGLDEEIFKIGALKSVIQ